MIGTMIPIRATQRGLLLRDGNFRRILKPGVYRLWSRLFGSQRDTVEIVDTLQTRFESPLLDVISRDEQAQKELLVLDLADTERAVVWKDGRLACFLGPGRYAFWRTPYALDVERFDIRENGGRLTSLRADRILASPEVGRWFEVIDAHAMVSVILFRDGKFVELLENGRHAFLKGAGQITYLAHDRREQVADVADQEIMTADKVTLRVNLVVAYQVTDPVQAVTEVADAPQALYREAQLALRAAVGTRTLDTLLSDKEAISGEMRGVLSARAAEQIRGLVGQAVAENAKT